MENFVITIARGYGSGGKTIGKMLAEQLGINFYDRDILRLASDESGISEALFAQADEKLKSTSLFKTAKDVYTGEIIPPDSNDFVSTKNLFNYQAKVIKELAAKESFVIAGRCADFVLKDNPNVIRVFVHAPLEHCIDVVAPMKNMSRKEAEKFILKKDKYRGEYYYHYTGKNWNDARNYDICLNSSELNYDKCIEIIKNYMEVRFK
ncbi:MAG: cytidylate kinase-like family protein [Lachnospiraceae bacterium]|nr:cytidylate kinase-like family protein [Lachnospiraceae bacterium]